MEYRQHRRLHAAPVRKKHPFTSAEQASPHRAGHYVGFEGEDRAHLNTAEMQGGLGIQQTQGEAEDEDDLDEVLPPRRASIVPRYNRIPTPDGYIEKRGNQQMYVHFVDTPPPMARASRTTEKPEQSQSLRLHTQRRHFHWLYWIGIVFLVLVVGYASLGAVGSWWQVHQDDSTYGRPRTFQMDAVVGHSDSQAHPSHFIALNLNRPISVIELPRGDVSH